MKLYVIGLFASLYSSSVVFFLMLISSSYYYLWYSVILLLLRHIFFFTLVFCEDWFLIVQHYDKTAEKIDGFIIVLYYCQNSTSKNFYRFSFLTRVFIDRKIAKFYSVILQILPRFNPVISYSITLFFIRSNTLWNYVIVLQ